MRERIQGSISVALGAMLMSTRAGYKFDLPLKVKVYTKGMETVQFIVSGMHCQSCSKALSSALRVLPGVYSVDANHDTGETRLAYDPAKVQLSSIRQQIEHAGFDVVGE